MPWGKPYQCTDCRLTVKTHAPIIFAPAGALGPEPGNHPGTLMTYYEAGFEIVCIRSVCDVSRNSTAGAEDTSDVAIAR